VVLSLSEAGTSRLEAALRVHNQREAEWAALLTTEELEVFNTVLAKLARAARSEDWVSHRF
jgi:DNA-binding MarR family transcriptional regulator